MVDIIGREHLVDTSAGKQLPTLDDHAQWRMHSAGTRHSLKISATDNPWTEDLGRGECLLSQPPRVRDLVNVAWAAHSKGKKEFRHSCIIHWHTDNFSTIGFVT